MTNQRQPSLPYLLCSLFPYLLSLNFPMLYPRAQTLLKTLIDRYIAEGQPVGSRTLSRYSGLELSPATNRNVMSDLEDLGLVVSPHTSAGRIPTPRGYRLFVDTMLTVETTDDEAMTSAVKIKLQGGEPAKIVHAAPQPHVQADRVYAPV